MPQHEPQDSLDQTLDEETVDAEAVSDDDATLPCLTILQGRDRGKRIQLQAGEATLDRSPEATIQIRDDRISRVHCRLTYDEAGFWIEDCESRNGTHANGQQVYERTALKPGALIRIGHTLLRLSLRHKAEVALEEEMFQAATTDPLTGIPNRRWFEVQGDACVTRARRHGHPLSLLMLAVDHFKRINDSYGHPCGDVGGTGYRKQTA